MQGRHSEATIAKSSISEMRGKIGYAPLQKLVARACLPLADAKRQPDAFYAGLRLVATDGSNLEVADEPGNVQAFGYPGSRSKEAGVRSCTITPNPVTSSYGKTSSHRAIRRSLSRDLAW